MNNMILYGHLRIRSISAAIHVSRIGTTKNKASISGTKIITRTPSNDTAADPTRAPARLSNLFSVEA